MKFIAIGRGEWLLDSVSHLIQNGHELVAVISSSAPEEYRIQLEDFRDYARQKSVPFLHSSLNSEISSFLNEVGSFEIGISVNHPRILNSPVIDHFPLGVLNFHGGDLPRYKGNACQVWAILNGEKFVGACVHRMIPNEIDTGAIISRRRLEIDDKTKVNDIFEWLKYQGPQMFLESIERLIENSAFEIRDSNYGIRPHRCHARIPSDAKIDWTSSAIMILRLINASGYPYKGAYCQYEGRVIRIFEAEIIILPEDISAVPGQIIQSQPDSFVVACGKNETIRISQFKLENMDGKLTELAIKSTRSRLY